MANFTTGFAYESSADLYALDNIQFENQSRENVQNTRVLLCGGKKIKTIAMTNH